MLEALPAVAIAVLFFGGVIGGVLYRELASRPSNIARKRLRQHTPCAIRAEEGALVRVSGAVTQSAVEDAPLSGRACVAWQLEIRYIMTSGRGRGGIRRRHFVRRNRPFTLRDATGVARVDVGEPELAAKPATTRDFPNYGSIPPALQELVRQDPLFDVGEFSAFRLVESTVEHGQEIEVLGTGSWQHDPSTPEGYRTNEGQLLLRPPLGKPLLLVSATY